ncbi:MAG TPA: ATP-binding protein [Burkholderiales bacterium]|jgi:two-component system, OmpR family, sensor histidine kinase QseC|nr:ATP-binding protein [Burkholderiales bacterium]
MRAVLLGGSIAVLVAVLGVAAWIGFAGSQDEADELFDARLATSARVLAALYATQPPPAAANAPIVVSFPGPLEAAAHDEAGPLGHYYETKIAFQVLDASGRLLMRSASAPDTAYAPLAAGFSTHKNWRVFTLRSGDVWVQAAERDDVRDELSEKLALAAVAPLIAGIPLLLLLIALLLRYGLAPLTELAQRIRGREPGSLAPIRLARSTAEIEPVLEALNALLERVQSAMARERRFTADAAHELRTPLAALKIHAQNAARATSEAERHASLERMLAGLERAIRLAEQMLALSRAAARAPAAERVSLRQAVEDALDDVLPKLKERGIKVSVAADAPESEPLVQGERDKLATLARNLLDNAARYSPAGSTVRVEIAHSDHATRLSVSDEGPGIPPELRERVFESYYRIPGAAGEGSGLGLAIVREIAAQHGATVQIGQCDGGRGTRVVVSFPS